jgi:hypothetical protein
LKIAWWNPIGNRSTYKTWLAMGSRCGLISGHGTSTSSAI